MTKTIIFKKEVRKGGQLLILTGVEIKLRVDALSDIKFRPWLKSDENLSSFGVTHNWWRKYIF